MIKMYNKKAVRKYWENRTEHVVGAICQCCGEFFTCTKPASWCPSCHNKGVWSKKMNAKGFGKMCSHCGEKMIFRNNDYWCPACSYKLQEEKP